ncbi:mitochondrial import inner membrane translocase subunit TIM13 [Jackrogersella minutella]|nr:mitochondrial import inner membrane translocase subunit TIM13 [Jackrogersella minutella]
MESETIKSEVMKQVQAQYAVENARSLIEKINEHCFEKCVPKPGSSFSSGEKSCATQCMEKYMQAWNQVSATYIHRIQKESSSSF